MRLLFVLVPFLMACQLDSNVECSHTEREEIYNELIWVCHNPENPAHHGQKCTDECFEEGDTGAFCWILETEECSSESSLQSFEAACEALDLK